MTYDAYKGGFDAFFQKATGHTPYPYQKRLATETLPSIINVATGAGKTEAAILCVWLWRRLKNIDGTPRRLVYCLPRRVLVEQTVGRVNKWLENLKINDRIRISTFMGGNADKELELHPASESIIIGTQDMLVSSALNRAYGSSPYGWPRLFGLLNNDCMWVMDEVQLMENTLPTSRQIDAFRNTFGVYGNHHTIWMSATTNAAWLDTVDSPLGSEPTCRLSGEDKAHGALKKRNNARKILHKADVQLDKGCGGHEVHYLHGLHKPGTTTAIMVNTVKKAQDLYDAFQNKNIKCTLIHSRFREAERLELNRSISGLEETDDRIIISTQVLESGMDISVRTLVTELAPWSSLVQRFGRCNRRGTLNEANIYWMDICDPKKYAPYSDTEMNSARQTLKSLTGKSVSPGTLKSQNEYKEFDAVLRKKDLLDFFDTTPDLSGNYVDASRFIRNVQLRLDVNVFWRDESDKTSRPDGAETCPVPISELRAFLKDRGICGRAWNYKEGEWEPVRPDSVFPGQLVMLDNKKGGYTSARGWSASSKEEVKPVESAYKSQMDSHGGDAQSWSSISVTLEDHTNHVLEEARKIMRDLPFLDASTTDTITTAVRYHDIGKTHDIFQDTMRRGMNDTFDKTIVWAKCERDVRHGRPGFRHEVASALAYLAHTGNLDSRGGDLVAYLIMSHHGKVRLSMRDVVLKGRNGEYLLGLRVGGDELPEFSCGAVSIKKTALDMTVAQMGRLREDRPSWTERTLALLGEYGPFKLAYLEMLVRAADTLASKKEREGKYT